MSFADVLNLALQLPSEDRTALAEMLLHLELPCPDADHEAAWNAEIIARMERFDRGESTATDWREALAEMRQSLRGGPPA